MMEVWLIMAVNTFTDIYKQISGCSIQADIYQSEKEDASVVVFIHGGALIWGSRVNLDHRQIALYLEAGFSVVSIDYRLAPESKIASIIEDIQDALIWISTAGAEKYGLNGDRLAVVGSSAGGYLSLMSGTFSRKPKAIVSFYGYGDLLGDWYCKPSPFYCRQPMVSLEEARGCVGQTIRSEGATDRFKFYLHCRQQGIWTSEVSGYDVYADRKQVIEYCPAYCAGVDYPPTLLLHGDLDTDVPYQQSVIMTQKLNHVGVANRLITLEGKGHGFDYEMEDPAVRNAFTDVIQFLGMHLA